MEKSKDLNQDRSLAERVRQFGVGLALSAVALGGGALVADGAVSFTHDVAITTEHAQPSNTLANGFTILEEAGAVLGAAVLLKRGARNFKLAFDPQESALDKVAHSSDRHKTICGKKAPRVLATCGLLTTFTGVVAGNFFNISDNVAKTQSNVAALFKEVVPHVKGQEYVISNNPTPNMLNSSSIGVSELGALETQANKNGVSLMPIQHDWGGGAYTAKSANNANLEFLTIGLPNQVVHIPLADSQCNNVEANVSSALGVKPNEFFDLQGINVRVHDLINGGAGFNLIPVILNNADYNRCLLGNAKDTSYSMVIAEGSKHNVNSVVDLVSNNNQDPARRLYAVTASEFVANAKETGKNAVDGLVLEAMLIGMALGTVALNFQTSKELANNRSRNRMLKANGSDEHLIMKIYKEKAEADAVASALLAMPGTLIVDALVNHAQPGGALGVNIETYVAVTGFLWAINQISTSMAVRREARKMANERGMK